MKELTVTASIDKIAEVTAFVDSFLEEHDCSIKVQMQIDIAIDELFSNVCYYAYDEKDGLVIIRIDLDETSRTFEMSFIDNGKQYDPLKREDPDITLSAEERGVGGLGVYIVKKSMDELKYEYIDNQNVLTIKKCIG